MPYAVEILRTTKRQNPIPIPTPNFQIPFPLLPFNPLILSSFFPQAYCALAQPMMDIMRPAADPSARWEKNSSVLQQVQAFKS